MLTHDSADWNGRPAIGMAAVAPLMATGECIAVDELWRQQYMPSFTTRTPAAFLYHYKC